MIHAIAVYASLAGLAWFLWRTFWMPVLTTEQPKLDAWKDSYSPGGMTDG